MSGYVLDPLPVNPNLPAVAKTLDIFLTREGTGAGRESLVVIETSL